MDVKVRAGIDMLLARGTRDWGPCYGECALMQTILERTMIFLQDKEAQAIDAKRQLQQRTDELYSYRTRLNKLEHQLQEKEAYISRTYR